MLSINIGWCPTYIVLLLSGDLRLYEYIIKYINHNDTELIKKFGSLVADEVSFVADARSHVSQFPMTCQSVQPWCTSKLDATRCPKFVCFDWWLVLMHCSDRNATVICDIEGCLHLCQKTIFAHFAPKLFKTRVQGNETKMTDDAPAPPPFSSCLRTTRVANGLKLASAPWAPILASQEI